MDKLQKYFNGFIKSLSAIPAPMKYAVTFIAGIVVGSAI